MREGDTLDTTKEFMQFEFRKFVMAKTLANTELLIEKDYLRDSLRAMVTMLAAVTVENCEYVPADWRSHLVLSLIERFPRLERILPEVRWRVIQSTFRVCPHIEKPDRSMHIGFLSEAQQENPE